MSLKPMDTSSSNYIVTNCDATAPWTAAWWQGDTTGRHYIAYCQALTIMSEGTTLQVSDSTAYADGTMVSTTGWTHLTVECTNAGGGNQDFQFFQDGTHCTTVSGSTIGASWAGTATCFRGAHLTADLRIVDGTYDSSAWAYYRSDVLSGGDRVLPA
jgi:hypothetical protein